ncbi:hypothetical protein C5167_020084 [Papaver somniferum]|uniref:Box C/D snoRNA protein 1 n=1 Tax=Papaver somniferum TaxID=3469 RepID=A0A4Y7IS20_PAPSO|nr:box C/D snoRNA protein 1-like [Papaver somniferum]RZC51673.1 hypothetical protein C5167_020084 [Papaver somniferum]
MVEGEEEKSSTENPKLKESSSMCEECKENPWKYKCPGCLIRSCSLPCVKSHKKRTSCTGKRPRDEIIPLSQFDDNLLISDYRFLEEAKRVAESAKRTRKAVFGDSLGEANRLPFRIIKLRLAAGKRRTQLVFLPDGMSRREKNMSSYQHRKESITWTIEWRFHSTDVALVDNRVDERTKLCSVIEKHLKLGPWNHKLRPFCEEQLDRLKFFIRINAKRPESSYRELDIKSSISQQLANTLIVEYPVIYVFLPSASFDFKVVKDAAPPPYKLSEPNSPIPERVTFKVEEPKEEEDPQILDPIKCVNAESMFRRETEDTDELFFSNFEDLKLPENSVFNFEQDLRDAYAGLIGDINPDDFLDLDGEFPQGFSDKELEEGEIPA